MRERCIAAGGVVDSRLSRAMADALVGYGSVSDVFGSSTIFYLRGGCPNPTASGFHPCEFAPIDLEACDRRRGSVGS